MPLLKFDGRVGRLYIVDRVHREGEWINEQHDVTDAFQGVFYLDGLQTGWIAFPKGAAPDMVLVPVGEDAGECPGEGYKEGLRVLALLPDEKDARELLATSKGVWLGFKQLYESYEVQASKHPGKLPLVNSPRW
jgi:hypothetical protein